MTNRKNIARDLRRAIDKECANTHVTCTTDHPAECNCDRCSEVRQQHKRVEYLLFLRDNPDYCGFKPLG